jgi:hypothetical protein
MIKPKQDIMTLSEIPSIEVTGRATARPWHNGLEDVKDKTRAGVVGVFLSGISTAGTTIYLRISISTPTEGCSSLSNYPGLFLEEAWLYNKKQITDREGTPPPTLRSKQ